MDKDYFDDIFYTASLVEYISRCTHNEYSDIVNAVGRDAFYQLIDLADVNHCLSFLQVSNEFSDEITKQMSRVNYWIAKIENDGLQSVKEEIENFDTSALDKSFFMAKLILLKNYSSATTCIEDLCDKGELDNTAIEEWPLFKEYRKTDEYIKFKESHPELFGVLTSETEPNDPLGDLQVTQNVKAELKNT